MSAARARLGKIVLPMIVILLVIAIWWIVVVQTESAIFPTPWQVVAGALELARDGTLWEHIGASLFRVGTGFGLAARGRHPARPAGWAGSTACTHAQSDLPDPAADLADRLDPARDPVVRRRRRLADLPHLHLVGVSR